MSQADLAYVGKFFLAFCGYFIGTGLIGMVITGDSGSENLATISWLLGGIAFAVLALFM